MPKKEKILVFYKQLGEYFCSQAEKIGYNLFLGAF